MTQHSLVFEDGRPCGWCLVAPATTRLYGTPTCYGCATATGKERVQRWLSAVERGANRETQP